MTDPHHPARPRDLGRGPGGAGILVGPRAGEWRVTVGEIRIVAVYPNGARVERHTSRSDGSGLRIQWLAIGRAWQSSWWTKRRDAEKKALSLR